MIRHFISSLVFSRLLRMKVFAKCLVSHSTTVRYNRIHNTLLINQIVTVKNQITEQKSSVGQALVLCHPRVLM